MKLENLNIEVKVAVNMKEGKIRVYVNEDIYEFPGTTINESIELAILTVLKDRNKWPLQT